ncbi:hypothetical protein [Actinomadura sp. CNU-125]|uniref:hypothetical protein n=1 Tax=Actinomadura sp. CNU-125 TaxID=1904961 RepID=UPI000AE2E29B|nr:hypothetical protein [Actinomadura sp. CNU-125]
MTVAGSPLSEPPRIVQGGMGAGVSGWRLARAVARTGQLGVVSGVALDALLARGLQAGDEGGHLRRALARFPLRDAAERILRRYFVPGGIEPGERFRPVPKLGLIPNRTRDELTVAGNFAEVWLAKEGHDGPVGINYLEKIQLATPAAVYGAMLAGVDDVLMGAGIPSEIPALLDALAAGVPGRLTVTVAGAAEGRELTFDPAALGGPAADVPRPRFLAIVSSPVLAVYLHRTPATRPDGFVLETPVAGGHSAPPRGRRTWTTAASRSTGGATGSTRRRSPDSACRSGWRAGSPGRAPWRRRARRAPPGSRPGAFSRCAASRAWTRSCGDGSSRGRWTATCGCATTPARHRPGSRSRSPNCPERSPTTRSTGSGPGCAT